MKNTNELYGKFKTTAKKNNIQSGLERISEQKYFHQKLKALLKQKKNQNKQKKNQNKHAGKFCVGTDQKF